MQLFYSLLLGYIIGLIDGVAHVVNGISHVGKNIVNLGVIGLEISL